MSAYGKDYDKATESSEPAPKGHAAAVREAIEDAKSQPSHLSTPMPAHPAQGTHNGPGKHMASHKMAGGPGGEIL